MYAGVEKISNLSNKNEKKNDPRQTYISAPTNLQYKSLWKEIITSLKEYWKTEINNIMKNSYAAFLRYEISKAQKRINADE